MKNLMKIFKEKLGDIYKKVTLRRVFIFIDCIVLVIALSIVVNKLMDYYSNQKMYKNVGKMYNSDKGIGPALVYEELNNYRQAELDGVLRISYKFRDLLKINSDTVGWINIADTRIDYPVVQANNNDFYLHKNFEKKDSDVGAIFMDFRNKIFPLDKNIILYGHHMKDGSMFRDLALYNSQDFLDKNSIITFNTLYQESKWEIFSVYVVDAKDDYLITNFANDQDFLKYINDIKSKSLFKSDVQVNADDHILTLSTCSYEFNEARTVVHAKLIK